METRDPAASVLRQSGCLRRLARSLVRDSHRAEDAVQETLVTALERPDAPRASLRGWLGAVLRNRVRQEERARLRREQREHAVRAPASVPSAAETNARIELQARVLEAVRGLEEPYKSAIVQRFLDGLKPREIARAHGIPVKTVNTRLERGLAKLRARLDGKFGDRGAWLQALVPLVAAPVSLPWSPLAEGTIMGAKTKVAAAVVVLASAGWFVHAVLSPQRTSPDRRGEVAFPSASQDGSRVQERPLLADAAAQHAGPEPEPETARARESVPVAPAALAAAGGAGDSTLHVRVVKQASGEPVAARLELRVLAGTTEAAGRTELLGGAKSGADGRASFEVPRGTATLSITVSPERWDALDPVRRATFDVEPLRAGEARSLTLELEHGLDRTFYGQVVAAEDGRPLPGALLAPWPERDGSFTVAADAGGFFEYPYPSWEPDGLQVRHEGFGSKLLQLGRLDQTRAAPYVVALERAAAIEARIRLPGGLAHAKLWASSPDRSRWSELLDGAGRAVLAGLPPGVALGLELRAGDELLWRDAAGWSLAPGERRALVLDLGDGTLVHGRIRDQHGAPVVDQEVWAIAAAASGPEDDRDAIRGRLFEPDERGAARIAQPDAGGRFELAQLAPGRWWIGPAPRTEDEHAVAAFARSIELLPGEFSRALDLEARRDLWIRGRVLDPDGAPLGRIFVMATRADADGRLQVQADDDGAFALGPLAPGLHRLSAFGDGVFGWDEPLVVEAGTTGVELRVGARNSIAGRVVDAEGRGADAHAHLLKRGGSLGQSTSRREQGGFLFTDLPSGTWAVQAEAPDGSVALQQVELADGARITGLVLELRPGTRIGVSHDLERNVRCSIWSDGVLAADSTVRAGVEAFEVVPAGRIRVELYDGETLAERELEARAGRVETVVFDL